jgi:hypothetical protein
MPTACPLAAARSRYGCHRPDTATYPRSVRTGKLRPRRPAILRGAPARRQPPQRRRLCHWPPRQPRPAGAASEAADPTAPSAPRSQDHLVKRREACQRAATDLTNGAYRHPKTAHASRGGAVSVDPAKALALTGSYPGQPPRSPPGHRSHTLETVQHHLKPFHGDDVHSDEPPSACTCHGRPGDEGRRWAKLGHVLGTMTRIRAPGAASSPHTARSALSRVCPGKRAFPQVVAGVGFEPT